LGNDLTGVWQEGGIRVKFVIYANLVSPHTVPLAVELKGLVGDFFYVYQAHGGEPFRTQKALEPIGECAVCEADNPAYARHILRNCDVLLSGVRDFALMKDRVENGLLTIYQSERWFKPICLSSMRDSESANGGVWVSGFLKNMFPFAFRRAKKMVELMGYRHFIYLPIGIHAVCDMARLCGLFHGDLRCLFCSPKVRLEDNCGGRIYYNEKIDAKYGLDKMRLWGYYVRSGNITLVADKDDSRIGPLKILWLGRLLGWKNVDTIIKAVNSTCNWTLDIYGEGPEKHKLVKMAVRGVGNVKFHAPVPYDKVRAIMRDHDIYILSSNSFEGWGAVVNEALEEGMKVVGTYEAGASATILPETNLFHAGNWRGLRKILANPIPDVVIGSWTAKNAAAKLLSIVKEAADGE